MPLQKCRLSLVRGWGLLRKLLVEGERASVRVSERGRERESASSSGCITHQGEKSSHSLLLFLPESPQNLINSKPRLLFF